MAKKKRKPRIIGPPQELKKFVLETTDGLPSLKAVDYWYMDFVLERCGGSKRLAAHILGVNASTLYRMIRRREYEPDWDQREKGTVASDDGYITFIGFRSPLIVLAKMLAEALERRGRKDLPGE